MENKKPMTELDALAQLSELVEVIEKNNWEHILKQVDIPLTSRTEILSLRILKQDAEIITLRNLSKETEQKYTDMRVKLLAFKHLLKEIPDDK